MQTYLLEVCPNIDGAVSARISAPIPHSAASSPDQLSVTEVSFASKASVCSSLALSMFLTGSMMSASAMLLVL